MVGRPLLDVVVAEQHVEAVVLVAVRDRAATPSRVEQLQRPVRGRRVTAQPPQLRFDVLRHDKKHMSS